MTVDEKTQVWIPCGASSRSDKSCTATVIYTTPGGRKLKYRAVFKTAVDLVHGRFHLELLCLPEDKLVCEAGQRLGSSRGCGRVLANRVMQLHSRNLIYVSSPKEIQETILRIVSEKEQSTASVKEDPDYTNSK